MKISLIDIIFKLILILFPFFVDFKKNLVYNSHVKNKDKIMEKNLKKEMITSIEITRESIKNALEVTLESYTEAFSRLDLLTYLLLSDEKK